MPLPIEIIRSPRRRKTVGAAIVDGRVVVRVPQWMSADQADRHATELAARLERRHQAEGIDLDQRARTLARRYGLPEPRTVGWSSRQQRRWGVCWPGERRILLSSRLAAYPPWVVDYVLVHELAHLVERHHSPAFHALVARYPKAERAEGFLLAKEHGDDAPEHGPVEGLTDDVDHEDDEPLNEALGA